MVQQAVGKLVAGKTVLVIARLSTISADQIVVVNGGRSQDVGTRGTFEELPAVSGDVANIWAQRRESRHDQLF